MQWMKWLVGLVLLFAFGCGPSEPSTYRVTGTVTWKGTAIPEGDIIFNAQDGRSAPAAAKIVSGKYELRATPGKKRVEIHATREEGPPDPVMNAVPRVPYIPPKYNTDSTLDADVQANDKNQVDFSLVE